jgi:hypothetical protein
MELSLLMNFIGTIITIIVSIVSLAYWLGRKFATIDARFKGIDERFESLEKAIRNLAKAFIESHEIIVDFLALKGLLEKSEAEYLSRRIEGIFIVHESANPLTEEEWEFIRKYVSKAAKNVDDVTIEEADRAYKLGVKLFTEDFEWKGYLLAMAAVYTRGYHISKEVRKRKSKTSNT